MHATLPLLADSDFPALSRGKLDAVQVNLGYRCNQRCLHCHVNASPDRTESMDRDTIDQVLAYLSTSGASTLDITGGAPELNPHFRYLVERATTSGKQVIDRCNLTILLEPGHEDLAAFLATHRVEVVASLPCYLEDNVDRQRGKGVFGTSIRALRRSTTRRGRHCRRRSKNSRPTITATYSTISASRSTGCSRWPTCRSSASAAR
ncbi:MAG: radical SAM protein [Gammaproteobacteria bacterium]|nr:MAG: radical SAM protein [Gammaproteobacteria bacterium]